MTSKPKSTRPAPTDPPPPRAQKKPTPRFDPIIEEAVRIAGSIAALADMCGVRSPSIYRWKKIPAERVLGIEAGTGLSRHVLRPDIYPIGNVKPPSWLRPKNPPPPPPDGRNPRGRPRG